MPTGLGGTGRTRAVPARHDILYRQRPPAFGGVTLRDRAVARFAPAIHSPTRSEPHAPLRYLRYATPVNTIDSPLFGLSQRLPPSNVQAEQALLGALLANNKAYERVSEFLAAEHFADPIHGRIYQAISRRVEAGQLADAVTLKAEFEHAGILEEVGGTAYLTQLLTAMVGIINAGDYGRLLRHARGLRPSRDP